MRGRLSRLFLSSLCACACAAAVVSAQESGGGVAAVAQKYDEFGQLRGCDASARIDSFAIELQGAPTLKGYIVARDARDRRPGAAHAWGDRLLHYLTRSRGIEESRLALVDAAAVSGDDFKMELWLVPGGGGPPRVKPPGKDSARTFAGKYAEVMVFNETAFFDADGVDATAFNEGDLFRAYASVLKKQADSQGYLVVYSPPGAAPGYWQRAGTRERQKLLGGDLTADRLTIINGGAVAVRKKAAEGEEEEQTYGRVELWIGEKDSPPVRHVEEEAAPLAEAVMLATNNFFFPDEDDAAAWMLNNLAAALRADKDRKNVGCIVVYPGDGSTVAIGEGGREELPPDVFKLAEGWKAELLKKHGFEPHRVVILSGPPEDGAGGRLEVWAVPYGAPLPDPFAKAEEQAADEEEAEGEDGGEEQAPPPPSSTRGVNLKWQSRF
ncbi:MAG TPA: hypothetical protein VGX48_06655 [Pyrinomonadaceae bacterium]|jgi:hypothetical protein|nr:hypothetical protein [Pyrinomonadaceae bacterium]